MRARIRHTLFPLLAAFIWGTSFVAQRVSTEHIGAFTFNTLRSAVATVTLLIVWWGFSRRKSKVFGPVRTDYKRLLIGGIGCGVALTLASFLQQYGLAGTSAGKAGFITALYIVLVPLFGLCLGKRVSPMVGAAVVVAVMGLYLLCITEDFTIQSSDIAVMLCAVVFAIHILLIDAVSVGVNGVALSCVQFATATVLSAVGALVCDDALAWEQWIPCIGPILYVGIFSSGVAYTLQILAQKDANPTLVALLLSLESVFSVAAAAVWLGERMSTRETIGCVLMLTAVAAAQLPFEEWRAKKSVKK